MNNKTCFCIDRKEELEKEVAELQERLRKADEAADDISNVFSIGENARTRATILANIENSYRRSNCLSLIESYLSKIEIDEDGEKTAESLLNWGESPDDYIKTFIKALQDYKESE